MTAGKKTSERMCVGCRQMKEKGDLIRLVKSPDGRIQPDPGGKMNGRGAWLCKDPSCLQAAIKNHGFQRSFKRNVPDETIALLEQEITGAQR